VTTNRDYLVVNTTREPYGIDIEEME